MPSNRWNVRLIMQRFVKCVPRGSSARYVHAGTHTYIHTHKRAMSFIYLWRMCFRDSLLVFVPPPPPGPHVAAFRISLLAVMVPALFLGCSPLTYFCSLSVPLYPHHQLILSYTITNSDTCGLYSWLYMYVAVHVCGCTGQAHRKTPKELAPLLTGLLVAALFPQIIMVKVEEVPHSPRSASSGSHLLTLATHVHACTYSFIHAYTCPRACARENTHTHTHTHTHTRTRTHDFV